MQSWFSCLHCGKKKKYTTEDKTKPMSPDLRKANKFAAFSHAISYYFWLNFYTQTQELSQQFRISV